ncbi:hypothetical protein GQR58_023778 [Nymphon striatum]|nr:hypothetical protein GQR58_023778 [Nymphon striatum]
MRSGVGLEFNNIGAKGKRVFINTQLYDVIYRACRKIHKQVGEVGFEDAVARALKHAPNKKGGYRFKVIEIIRNSHTTKFAENNGTGRVGLRGLYYKLNLIRLNGENNLICSVLN